MVYNRSFNSGGYQTGGPSTVAPYKRGLFRDPEVRLGVKDLVGSYQGLQSNYTPEGYSTFNTNRTTYQPNIQSGISKLNNKIQNIRSSGNINQERLNKLRQRRNLFKDMLSYQGQTAAPTSNPEQDKRQQEFINALFPQTSGLEPQNFEGSPLYQFQRDEGITALDRELSAQGLTNSGAAIEAKRRFMTDLSGRETERFRDIAQTEADRRQVNADRLFNVANNSANFGYRAQQDNFNNALNLFSRLSALSPFNQGANAANQTAQNYTNAANSMASYLSQMFTQAPPAGAFSPGSFVPPPASGPDYSAINATQASFGGNSPYLNAFGNLIGSLF